MSIEIKMTLDEAGALLGFFQANRSAFCDDKHSYELTCVEQAVLRECERTRMAERYPAIEVAIEREAPEKPGAVGIHDLPIFGWAWQGDAQDTERY